MALATACAIAGRAVVAPSARGLRRTAGLPQASRTSSNSSALSCSPPRASSISASFCSAFCCSARASVTRPRSPADRAGRIHEGGRATRDRAGAASDRAGVLRVRSGVVSPSARAFERQRCALRTRNGCLSCHRGDPPMRRDRLSSRPGGAHEDFVASVRTTRNWKSASVHAAGRGPSRRRARVRRTGCGYAGRFHPTERRVAVKPGRPQHHDVGRVRPRRPPRTRNQATTDRIRSHNSAPAEVAVVRVLGNRLRRVLRLRRRGRVDHRGRRRLAPRELEVPLEAA